MMHGLLIAFILSGLFLIVMARAAMDREDR